MADRELGRLGRYLLHIANNHEDFREANHAVSLSLPEAMISKLQLMHVPVCSNGKMS